MTCRDNQVGSAQGASSSPWGFARPPHLAGSIPHLGGYARAASEVTRILPAGEQGDRLGDRGDWYGTSSPCEMDSVSESESIGHLDARGEWSDSPRAAARVGAEPPIRPRRRASEALARAPFRVQSGGVRLPAPPPHCPDQCFL